MTALPRRTPGPDPAPRPAPLPAAHQPLRHTDVAVLLDYGWHEPHYSEQRWVER